MMMRTLRPAACLAMAALAALALDGCGRGRQGSGPSGAGESTLARIRREGVIRWGADPSGGAPYVFFDPDKPDRVIGFEIDIMRKLAGHMGVRDEMVRSDWAALIDNMLSRRSDMVMNGIEINEERKKKVLFSKPYYIYEQQLTVRAADRDKYGSLDDLKGKRVATLNAAEANNVLLRAGFAEDLLVQRDDSLTPYTELELGRVEAVLQESIIASYYAGKNPKLHNVAKTFSPGVYAVAVRMGDDEFLAEMNRALEIMMKNGELAEIYRRWDIWNEHQAEIGISPGGPGK